MANTIRGIMQNATRGMPTGIHTVDLAHSATRIHTRGTPTGVHTVDLMPSALYFWVDGTRSVSTTLLMYSFILKCENIQEKSKTKSPCFTLSLHCQ